MFGKPKLQRIRSIKRPCWLTSLTVVVVWLGSTIVVAQDFRIYTHVSNLRADQRAAKDRKLRAPVGGRSVSLFHAAQVYDFIEGIGEVTIFQPTQRQFTIFSRGRMLATTISFDKIEQLQADIEKQADDYIKEMKRRGTPQALRVIDPIRFQLDPTFVEQFDPQTKQLNLKGGAFSYTVQCAVAEDPQIADVYLNYTDWMARLNTLLHPQALLPRPRLEMNDALRKRGLIPTSVTLHGNFPNGPHLRAQHKIEWKLRPVDRDQILQWQRQLQHQTMKHVDFQQFQQAVLVKPKRKS